MDFLLLLMMVIGVVVWAAAFFWSVFLVIRMRKGA